MECTPNIQSGNNPESFDARLYLTIQDPFRGGDNILVLCETCLPTGEPIPSNTRAKAREAFEAAPGLEPWFGIEQEYTLFDKDMVSASRPRLRGYSWGFKSFRPLVLVQLSVQRADECLVGDNRAWTRGCDTMVRGRSVFLL